jgi:hypothetical protein
MAYLLWWATGINPTPKQVSASFKKYLRRIASEVRPMPRREERATVAIGFHSKTRTQHGGSVSPSTVQRRECRLVHSPAAGRCRSPKRHRIWYRRSMHPDAASPLLPLVTLAAGVFLLVAPRIVSVAVAVYLVATGLLGLNAIYHFFR